MQRAIQISRALVDLPCSELVDRSNFLLPPALYIVERLPVLNMALLASFIFKFSTSLGRGLTPGVYGAGVTLSNELGLRLLPALVFNFPTIEEEVVGHVMTHAAWLVDAVSGAAERSRKAHSGLQVFEFNYFITVSIG